MIQENVNTRSPMGRFVFILFSALAELEREQVAERTSRAMLRHQANGCRTPRQVVAAGRRAAAKAAAV